MLLVLFILPLFLFIVGVGAKSALAGTTDSATTTTKQLPLIREKREMIIKDKQETRTILKDKKEEFREKLKAIRDEKKRLVVERIDEKISTMNKNHTARFSKVLEKLEMILNRITQHAQNLKSKGIDTLKLDSAVASAKSAINAAKVAIEGQAAKTYTLDVASESRLKTTVGSIVSMFRKDLRDVHKTVVEAKQAVQNAEMELAKVRGEAKEEAEK